jgi:hypothetical protein
MENQDKPNNATNVPDLETVPIPPLPKSPSVINSPLNIETIKRFFQVTGGSSLYCLSAVLIARGIVKLLKPVLVGSESLRDALPCLLTLHGYELALLLVLLLIVFKKVVDDAISLTILIGLFLIGTSVALGSVADRGIQTAMLFGVIGIVISFVKIFALRKFARIPFTVITTFALTGIIAYNYLGPALMARFISRAPSDAPALRDLWFLLYSLMLIGFLAIWINTIRQSVSQDSKTPFLQSQAMACLFSLIILFGSGVHQYMMAYAFTLERVVLDYVPAVTVGCLLLIELIRLSGKQNMIVDVIIACVPGVLTLYAIYNQSVLSSGQWALGLLCYPPIMLAGIGVAVAGLAYYRRLRLMWGVVFAYGLGVILTAGFSPQYPHDLNILTCAAVLVASLLIVGLIIRNPYVCWSAVIVLSLGLPAIDRFSEVTKNWQLTEPGTIAGVFGFGTLILYLIFKKRMLPIIRFFGALLLAIFIFDFLPASVHIRYLIVIVFLGVLATALWIRTKDICAILILLAPVLIRVYVLAKALAHWRYIILGFVALITGAYVSLFKRTIKVSTDSEKEEILQIEQK